MGSNINDEQRGIENRGLIPTRRDETTDKTIVGYSLVEETTKVHEFPEREVITRSGPKPITEVMGKGIRSTTRAYRSQNGEGPPIIEGDTEIYYEEEQKPIEKIPVQQKQIDNDETRCIVNKISGEKKERTKRNAIDKKAAKPLSLSASNKGGYDSFLKAIEEYKENERKEVVEKLYFDPELLPQNYLYSMTRAIAIKNNIKRMGRFEKLTRAFYVGLKISKNWHKYKKMYYFSGEETLWEFSRRITNEFLDKEYFPGFISSFTTQFSEKQIAQMLQYTVAHFDESSLNSPIDIDGRKVIRQAYQLVEKHDSDWRRWFKDFLTEMSSHSVDDLDPEVKKRFEEKYPRLYERALREGFYTYFRPGEL